MFVSRQHVKVRLSAPRALFTDPKFRQNRITYPYPVFPTVLGAIQSIYWKPQARFQIHSVGIIKAGRQATLAFNHTASAPRLAKNSKSLKADFATDRRNTVFLEDVEYLVTVAVEDVSGEHTLALKHAEMLRRRLTKGQCYRPPFMGAREMPLDFEDGSDYKGPFDTSLDINFVVLPSGFDYSDTARDQFTAPVVRPKFAVHRITDGIMTEVNEVTP